MKQIIIDKLPVYMLLENRFKTCFIGVNFFDHLNDKYIGEYNILCSLLTKTNDSFRQEEDLSYELENLYDSKLNASFDITGLVCKINFSTSFINPKFIKDPDFDLTSISDLLFKTILKPNLTKEKFLLEQQLFITDYERYYKNKRRYAGIKFMKHLIKNEPTSVGRFDMLSRIKKVTFESLLEAYNYLITLPCNMYVLGDLDESSIIASLKDHEITKLNPYFYDSSYEYRKPYIKHPRKVKYYNDEYLDSQSVVYIGYRQTKAITESEVGKYNFLNTMLGDFSSSILFRIVREKLSLCYTINSIISTRIGYIAISTGLSKENIDKAIKIITDIFTDIQNGKFDDEYIELTKTNFISTVRNSVNSQYQQLIRYNENIMGVTSKTDEEMYQEINSITKEDIINCAKNYKLDTIYVLRGSLW